MIIRVWRAIKQWLTRFQSNDFEDEFESGFNSPQTYETMMVYAKELGCWTKLHKPISYVMPDTATCLPISKYRQLKVQEMLHKAMLNTSDAELKLKWAAVRPRLAHPQPPLQSESWPYPWSKEHWHADDWDGRD